MPDALYDAPAFYRMLFDERHRDLSFYAGLAELAQAEVLELGIGTGRVALDLARRGHAVVGVDGSAPMLAALRRRLAAEPEEVRERVSVVAGDARTIELDHRFALILFPFNGLAHQHDLAALRQLLDNVRRHLAVEGRFAFDVTLPDPGLLQGASSSAPWFRHPETGEVCRCDEEARYDPLTQVLTFTASIRFMEGERSAQTLRWRLRQLFPQETLLLLEHAGFELTAPPTHLGDSLAYVCRRAARGGQLPAGVISHR